MRLRMVLKKLVSVPSGTVYGIEKAFREVVQCCREVDMYPKIQYIFGFSIFSSAKLGKPFSFGSRLLLEPHFWPSCCISWVFQMLFGNLAKFLILGPFWGPKAEQKWCFGVLVNFSTLSPRERPKIQKLAKFPNIVWEAHKMCFLEPYRKDLPN